MLLNRKCTLKHPGMIRDVKFPPSRVALQWNRKSAESSVATALQVSCLDISRSQGRYHQGLSRLFRTSKPVSRSTSVLGAESGVCTRLAWSIPIIPLPMSGQKYSENWQPAEVVSPTDLYAPRFICRWGPFCVAGRANFQVVNEEIQVDAGD